MDEEKVALHVERIRRALEKNGKHVDESEIRKAYLNYLITFGLGERRSEAKVLEDYGITPEPTPTSHEVKLNGLVPDERIKVRGRVISINRAVSSRDGVENTRYYGILKDDTGTAPFNAWENEGLEEIQKGDDIEIDGAYVGEWNGEAQIRITKYSTIRKVELDFEIPDSVGSRGPAEEVKLVSALPGRRIAFTARVLSVEERKINARGEEKTIYSGILADESAKVPFTAWKDFNLIPGDLIKVSGAYVRAWRNTPQINLDDGMDVEKIDADFPDMDELDRGTPMRIWQVEERGGANDALIRATIIQVKPGSGLIFRCPICRWVLQDGVCKKHGKVDGVPDLRIKAVMDDGSGALNLVAGKEVTAAILEKSVEQCVKEAKDSMDRSVVFRQIEELVLAKDFLIRGNVVSDEMSSTMIVTEMTPIEQSPVEIAEELIEEWGV